MIEYLIVRTIGLRLHLLRPDDYERLIRGEVELEDLPEYRSLVTAEAEEARLRAVHAKFVERASLLLKVCDSHAPFVRAFLDRLEVENVRARLRGALSDTDPPYYYPYSHFIDLEALAGARSLDRVMRLLRGTPYEVRVRRSAPASVLEMALDSAYFAYYRKEARRSGLKCLMPLIDREALARLLYWTLRLGESAVVGERSLLRGFEPASLSVRLRPPLLDRLAGLFRLDAEQLRRMERHGEVSRAVRVVEGRIADAARRSFLRERYAPIAVYYYLLLCYNEMRNLERILLGKMLGLRPELIRGAVLAIPL